MAAGKTKTQSKASAKQRGHEMVLTRVCLGSAEADRGSSYVTDNASVLAFLFEVPPPGSNPPVPLPSSSTENGFRKAV